MLSWLISITKPILEPIIDVVDSSMYAYILSNFVRNITLFEAMIVSDGIYNALTFTKEYMYYKIKYNLIANDKKGVDFDKKKVDFDIKKELLSNYQNVYTLSIIDRYILYSTSYLSYKLITIIIWSWKIILLNNYNDFYKFIDNIYYTVVLLSVFPYIQNIIIKLNPINKYIDVYLTNKQIFIKYSFSKIIINFIKSLDSRINFIKNSQIFVLYRYISYQMVIDFVKSYCFIYFLYFLKHNQTTYYYYKMIKLAYYYNTGHLFNQITTEDSIYIINIIVSEKKWNDLSNLEIVHALYTLINNKYNSNDNIYVTFSLYFAKFFTLWSFICLLKILKIELITFLLFTYFIIDYYYRRYKTTKFMERSGIVIVLYCLLLFNINDLVISTILVFYKFIYLIYCELVFFITNVNDIKKVLIFYKNQTTQKTIHKDPLILNLEDIELIGKFP
jgi:hypothetical protein